MGGAGSCPNPDLEVLPGNKQRWNVSDYRRWGFHNLHRIARYGLSLRAARVMRLQKRIDLRIADLESVRNLTTLPDFSAMIVTRGSDVLFERYAPDFGWDQPHSVQSITKTTINLMVGKLVETGAVDLARTVDHYLPEIGSGYARATVQQVLNMDVINDYSEDFSNPASTYYRHEEAMGWRLPLDPAHEQTQRRFLPGISSKDSINTSGRTQYKDANTDVLGWIVERASGTQLRALLADIVDAAGLEGAFYITTDREGVPALDGGACLTARDLARYMSIFARRGKGISGELVGSEAFIDTTLVSGVPMPEPYVGYRYSNHTRVAGRWLGHGGWGGQCAMVNMDTGVVGVYFSVKEDEHAATRGYLVPVIKMMEEITGADFQAG